VVISTGKVLSEPVVAYMPIRIGPFGRISEEDYIPAQRVHRSRELSHTVVARAQADFLAWLARYERYSEFLEVFSPVIRAYRALEQSDRVNGKK